MSEKGPLSYTLYLCNSEWYPFHAHLHYYCNAGEGQGYLTHERKQAKIFTALGFNSQLVLHDSLLEFLLHEYTIAYG